MTASLVLLGVLRLTMLATASGDDAAEVERRALQGTWRAVAYEAEEGPLPPEFVRGYRWVVRGNEVTLQAGGQQVAMTLTLGPTHDPKQLDLTATDGPLKEKVATGIYSLSGDTLRVYLNDPPGQGKRPDRFDAKPSAGRVLLSLKREKK